IVAGRLSRLETAIPELLSRIDAIREHAAAAPAAGGAAPPASASAAGDELIGRLDAVEAALVVLTEQLTAEPEPAGDDDEPDPVAEQLAELAEGLFGEDGLVARLEGAAVDEDSLDRRI